MKLLSVSNDSKTSKGEKMGYLTGVMYFAPVDISGFNVCPMASAGCKKACLYSAGRGRFNNVQQARINRTKFFYEDRPSFMLQLEKELKALIRKAEKLDLIPAVRLNGTSDIFCSQYFDLMVKYSHVQFYDYTKVYKRFFRDLPLNYYLTFSRSEENENKAIELLNLGFNVAVVFDQLPETWNGFKVIDGDTSDVRFLDASAVVVGLKAKGEAKKDITGFTVKTGDI